MRPEFLFATDIHGSRYKMDALVQKGISMGCPDIILGGDLLPMASFCTPRSQREVLLDLSTVMGDYGGRFFTVFGNNDMKGAVEGIEELCSNLRKIEVGSAVLTSGRRIHGISYVPVTPFRTKDWEAREREGALLRGAREKGICTSGGKMKDCTVPVEPTIMDMLEGLDVERGGLLVSHGPPHGTNADIAHDGTNLGSRDLRIFMKRRGLKAVLCGHIHESPGRSGRVVDLIDGTLVANPGSRRGALDMVLGYDKGEDLELDVITVTL